MDGAPKHLISASGSEWSLKGVLLEKEIKLEYGLKDTKASVEINPVDVETDWTRKGRPEPKSEIIVQGKYECAAASLAMLLGEKLFTVKRAMGKVGWTNSDRGASDRVMTEAARYLGRDLLYVTDDMLTADMGPASLTIKSLNVKGMSHAVTWNGKETLDPNWGRAGRIFWGCEWNPKTIGARGAMVLLDKPLSLDQRARQDKVLKAQRGWYKKHQEFAKTILKELEAA